LYPLKTSKTLLRSIKLEHLKIIVLSPHIPIPIYQYDPTSDTTSTAFSIMLPSITALLGQLSLGFWRQGRTLASPFPVIAPLPNLGLGAGININAVLPFLHIISGVRP
jgi:hypothetical protein